MNDSVSAVSAMACSLRPGSKSSVTPWRRSTIPSAVMKNMIHAMRRIERTSSCAEFLCRARATARDSVGISTSDIGKLIVPSGIWSSVMATL